MERPDPMIPCKPGAQDVQAMAARTLWLEELFFLDGRDQISHPMHGLFTGLWHDFCLYEAGPTCRDAYFAKLKAIKHFQELELQQKKVKITKEDFIPTLHD